MTLENRFQVKKGERIKFIEDCIVGNVPQSEQEQTRETASRIVNEYAGLDIYGLTVLEFASVQGRFQEFAIKLEKYYVSNLMWVAPDLMRDPATPQVQLAKLFFQSCYPEMRAQLLRS